LGTPDQVAAQIILLQEDGHPDAPPAGIKDRLSNRPRVDLLHRNVQAGLGASDELDDHLLQIISRTQLRQADKGLDLPVGKARHERDSTSSQ
jgi:hypothetical protein